WQVAVGVALHHGKTLGDTAIHTCLFDFQPSCACAALSLQQLHELPVPAADIQHEFAGIDELRNGDVVGPPHAVSPRAGFHCPARRGSPRACAAASIKPARPASNSGSSTKKASCPLSVSMLT